MVVVVVVLAASWGCGGALWIGGNLVDAAANCLVAPHHVGEGGLPVVGVDRAWCR